MSSEATGLQGRNALVTGGGTGIGYGCAVELARTGANVTIAGRRVEVLADAADRLRSEVPGAVVDTVIYRETGFSFTTFIVRVDPEVAEAVVAAGFDLSLPMVATYVYTEDLEGMYARAVEAGAMSVMPPMTVTEGIDTAWLIDPAGNHLGLVRITME